MTDLGRFNPIEIVDDIEPPLLTDEAQAAISQVNVLRPSDTYGVDIYEEIVRLL